jgi:hypothetical protein
MYHLSFLFSPLVSLFFPPSAFQPTRFLLFSSLPPIHLLFFQQGKESVRDYSWPLRRPTPVSLLFVRNKQILKGLVEGMGG